jgi:hypothetical protein
MKHNCYYCDIEEYEENLKRYKGKWLCLKCNSEQMLNKASKVINKTLRGNK